MKLMLAERDDDVLESCKDDDGEEETKTLFDIRFGEDLRMRSSGYGKTLGFLFEFSSFFVFPMGFDFGMCSYFLFITFRGF